MVVPPGLCTRTRYRPGRAARRSARQWFASISRSQVRLTTVIRAADVTERRSEESATQWADR
ncbi:hypothetical protein C5E43_08670 [Nocardia cyriacigeorgica]|nr:hypothetical protein C5B73_12915 [Nocardia cyriacigeorgica]PPJ13689.1 hypothetical protein C5E43_08670 [Nocardia cyriacigeorgica]